MRNMSLLAIAFLTTGLVARAPQPAGQSSAVPLGTPGPNLPKGKAPEQGYVPEGWHPHAGSLLKYSVQIRFGEEPETMPEGMKFGRVSAVTTDAQNNVYVFKRDPKTDQIVVFDSQGTYLRSWGKGMFARPHGLRVDHEGNIWAANDWRPSGLQVHARRQAVADARHEGRCGQRCEDVQPSRPILPGIQGEICTYPTATATRAS